MWLFGLAATFFAVMISGGQLTGTQELAIVVVVVVEVDDPL